MNQTTQDQAGTTAHGTLQTKTKAGGMSGPILLKPITLATQPYTRTGSGLKTLIQHQKTSQ